MNDFDFYSIEAQSSSKRALNRVGTFRPDAIRTQLIYGGKFPRTLHKVTLGYVDVMEIGHYIASKKANEILNSFPQIEGVLYSINFQPRD